MYQTVKHLLLLIGRNPLPNAVAGCLLADTNATISLIHSNDTARVSDRLKGWLSQRRGDLNHHIFSYEVEESSPPSIVNKVHEALAGALAEVGLHYTGGTKAMSVHTYMTLARWAERNGKHVSLSYLDARSLSLITHSFDVIASPVAVDRVDLALKMSLEDLLDLHGWRFKSQPRTQPLLPEAAAALARAHTTDDGTKDWNQWLKSCLFQYCMENVGNRKWKGNGKLKQITVPLPCDPSLKEVVEALTSELKTNRCLSIGAAAEAMGFGKCEDVGKWLEGTWLEEVAHCALESIEDDCQLHSVISNINPEAPGDVGSATNFEFDVAALRGYQLFAISCTTDTEHLVKLKLFEAYVRAEQLGGDEARVALLCPVNNPGPLERQMQRDLPEGRIRVFGREHLKDLAGHLRDWIRQQSQSG